MFYLNLILLIASQMVFGKVDMVSPHIYEGNGLGEVQISTHEIPITGTTTVDGSVPVTGAVTFDGVVRASGTVTIVARSGPSMKPRISTPGPLAIMLVTPRTSSNIPMPVIPILLRAISLPITQRVSSIPIPTLQPVTAAAPPLVPSVSFPAPVTPSIPNIAVSNFPVEEVPSCNQVVISGNDIPLTGSTVVDGVIPMTGDMAFNGFVPAKGSVMITCRSF